MIRIGLLGSQGRMGQQIVSLANTEFAHKVVLDAQPKRGDTLAPLLKADVIIDFSHPSAVIDLIEEWQKAHSHLPVPLPFPALIVGSTGWDTTSTVKLEALSMKTSVFMAANFSIGIALLSMMIKKYTPVLQAFHYTPSILETHHCHKKDAPSGTAIALQKIIADILPNSTTRIESSRIGEVIGDHEICYSSGTDQIRLSHHAQDRALFARGALEVALWITRRALTPSKPVASPLLTPQLLTPKLLTMDDYFQEYFHAFNV